MKSRQESYFETTSRAQENCEKVIELKKQLVQTNNCAWKALAEVQNITEALTASDLDHKSTEHMRIVEQTQLTLEQVDEQHQQLTQTLITQLKTTSRKIADDMELMETMAKERESFDFHQEFKTVGSMIVTEFRKPTPELDEAEELRSLIQSYKEELLKVA